MHCNLHNHEHDAISDHHALTYLNLPKLYRTSVRQAWPPSYHDRLMCHDLCGLQVSDKGDIVTPVYIGFIVVVK